MSEQSELLAHARGVLEANDQGQHTIPSEGIYPHQWLWDSCFIAIGQRHYDIGRAQTEILSLLRGQWRNGMMPNIILTDIHLFGRSHDFWQSNVNPHAPDDLATSGVTQPPMLAEAVVQIGAKLSLPERRSWYRLVFPALRRYHEWLYQERDPHQEGLTLQIHPWETGMDNTPPWMVEIRRQSLPFWIRCIEVLHLIPIINIFRKQPGFVPAEEHLSTLDALVLYSIGRSLRRKAYDIHRILDNSPFAIEDLSFNCILIRANQHLQTIAKTLREPLSPELLAGMQRTEKALEQLWDPYSGQYYSRNFVSHKFLKQSTIATLLPLYAGNITKDRAKLLVNLLHNQHLFGADHPVPTLPLNSPYFKPHSYWQGPTWINMNWLIIDGLERYGFKQEADIIRAKSLELVAKHGCYEYFSPLDGSPAGANNFSWTAALTIDLLKT